MSVYYKSAAIDQSNLFEQQSIRNELMSMESPTAAALGGAKKRKPTHTHKGRKYVVRRGPRGGKYILVKQIKIYI